MMWGCLSVPYAILYLEMMMIMSMGLEYVSELHVYLIVPIAVSP
jgi:hypothetical protein